jgi:hypothetical protein
MKDSHNFTVLMTFLCQGVFPTAFFVLKKVEEAKDIIINVANDEDIS